MNKTLLFSLISSCLLLSACEKSIHIESTTSTNSNQSDSSQSSHYQSVSSSETNDETVTVIDENSTFNKNGNYNIAVNTGTIIINGKEIQQNDEKSSSDDKKERIEIKLTNEFVKIPVDIELPLPAIVTSPSTKSQGTAGTGNGFQRN